MKIGKYETHPAADLLPLLEGEEFRALQKSIIERGLERPIELFEGKVLDGRNRLRACIEVNKEPVFAEWKGGDPYDYVWAHNVVRRHLSADQRVAIRLKFDEAYRAEAERRRAAANEARSKAAKEGRVGRAAKKPQAELEVEEVQSVMESSPTKPGDRKTRADLAKRAEVGVEKAQRAITLQKESPELLDKVAAGEVGLAEAYRQVKGIPQHSGASAEWFTPPDYVEAARAALGGRIDTDPASCDQANEVVKAGQFYSEDDNGLARNWTGNVFLNPPGGLVPEFWERLVALWEEGEVERAIWIGYSLEQLQTLQRFETIPLDFILCIPRRRIAFVAPAGGKASPTHANYIAFLPTRTGDELADVRRFQQAFEPFGAVVHWYRTREPLPAIERDDQVVEDVAHAEELFGKGSAAVELMKDQFARNEREVVEVPLPNMDSDDWASRPAGSMLQEPAPKTDEEWERDNADLIAPDEEEDGVVAEHEARVAAEKAMREAERRFQKARAALPWPKRIAEHRHHMAKLSTAQRRALDALNWTRIGLETKGRDGRPETLVAEHQAILNSYPQGEIAELANLLDEELAIRTYEDDRRGIAAVATAHAKAPPTKRRRRTGGKRATR